MKSLYTTKYLSTLLLLLVLAGACKKDFLENEQPGGVPTDRAITNIDDMETALNRAYAGLRDDDLYGRTIPLFGDLFADNVYISSQNSNRNSALYDLISATDVRKKMWEPSPNATNFPLPASNYTRQPYMSRKFKTRANPTVGDVPYIRLAEMYLILAEANARSGKEGDAKQALFTLAKNRDPQYTLSANTGQALINEILIQRRVELWAEGFRFFDLKRLNLPLDRTVVPNFVSASVGGTMQVPAGDERFVFVIPQAEIQANPNSVQN